ncbi:MAG: hypothetical protein ACXWET_06845 [Halobacteriota archaeon]
MQPALIDALREMRPFSTTVSGSPPMMSIPITPAEVGSSRSS